MRQPSEWAFSSSRPASSNDAYDENQAGDVILVSVTHHHHHHQQHQQHSHSHEDIAELENSTCSLVHNKSSSSNSSSSGKGDRDRDGDRDGDSDGDTDDETMTMTMSTQESETHIETSLKHATLIEQVLVDMLHVLHAQYTVIMSSCICIPSLSVILSTVHMHYK